MKNEKLDVAVLGLGSMGGTHVEAAKESSYVNKIYGYEPNPERLANRAVELDVIPASLDEIIRNPQIKLVYIASVNEAHVPQAVMALEAGKAVLCEKPMGMSLDEARGLIQVQEKTGGFLQVGFELHYSKLYMLAKKWIDAGLIGTPMNIQCRYFCCEFHHKNTWRSNNAGSFLIGEKLSHYLDLQRWFFSRPAESVYSLSAPKIVKYFRHRDNHQIMTKFSGGGVGVLNFIMYLAETHKHDPLQETIAKQADDGHFLQYHIVGAKGAIEADVFKRRIRRWEFKDGPLYPCLQSKIVETITFPQEEDLIWFHNTHGQNVRVAELAAKGLPPEVSAKDAFETMKLCFAAEQSEDTGRIVSMNSLN